MANIQADVDLREAQVSAPRLEIWFGWEMILPSSDNRKAVITQETQITSTVWKI